MFGDRIKILPLAFESLGVRSMATFVSTDIKITIDPGASLGPKRYGLPPTDIENNRLNQLKSRIKDYSNRSDILTISHYHFDHFFPNEKIYPNKTLLIKSPENKINYSQKKRNYKFEEFLDDLNVEIKYADNKIFEFNNTLIKFSDPVFHGKKDTKLGYVLMCSINYDEETLVHASDVQGPANEKALKWIIKEEPDYLIIGGPPTYLQGFKVDKKTIYNGIKNIKRILDQTNAKIIVDHHLVRDKNFGNKLKNLRSDDVMTAAEYLEKENLFLEAYRKELNKIENGKKANVPFSYDQIM